MRASWLVLAAAGIIAPAALAGGSSIGYLGLRGSYVMAEDQKSTSPNVDDERSFDDGWGAAGFAGFVLTDALRGEIELGYRVNELNTVEVTRNLLLPPSVGSKFNADGQVDMGTAMFNLFYDIHIDGFPVLPWVGAGAGAAYVNYAIRYDYGDPFAPYLAKDQDWQFAYQLMAGLTIPVSETASMSVGYRYFGTEEMTYVDAYGLEFATELTNQSVDVGLQFHL
jgi:opacity protein-like surface antigen